MKDIEDLKRLSRSKLNKIGAAQKKPKAFESLAENFLVHLKFDVTRDFQAGIIFFGTNLRHYLGLNLDYVTDDPSDFIRQLSLAVVEIYKLARQEGILYRNHNYMTPQELVMLHSGGYSRLGPPMEILEYMADAPDPYIPILLQEKVDIDVKSVIEKRIELEKIRVHGDYYGFVHMVPGSIWVDVSLEKLGNDRRTLRDPYPLEPFPLVPGAPIGERYETVRKIPNFPYSRV